MERERVQAALAGPIASIRTPFAADGSVDYASLGRIVEFDIAAGASALLITWGDSLFAVLSDAEIATLTQAVVEAAAGRVAVVASTNRWATPQAVEFGVYCREIGADMVQVFLPQWYAGCLSRQTIVDHYLAIAQCVPAMANSAEFQRNGAAEGLAIARELIERAAPVLAMKADVTGGYDAAMTTLVRDHWTLFAGGQKAFHLELWPYGCRGYLSTFVTFMPEVTRAYWQAIGADDRQLASRIIEQIDRPFFDEILAMPGGFDAALHGITERCGLTGRWRRAPFTSLDDAAVEQLADTLDRLQAAMGQLRAAEDYARLKP